MLKIGFSNKYYTLWNIGSETKIGYGNLPYMKHHFQYIQNLSIDKETAISKAKEMGCADLEVDESLRGQNSSFMTEEKLYCFLGRDRSPFFEYGKYSGKLILESDDLNYIEWYYDQTKNKLAEKKLIDSGILVNQDGKIVHSDVIKKENLLDNLINNLGNKQIIEFESNLSEYALFSNLDGAGTFIEIENTKIYFHFENVKEYFYNQYNYFLPTIKGAGKRIKGRKLELIGEVLENFDEDYYGQTAEEYLDRGGKLDKYFHITEFKILPKTK